MFDLTLIWAHGNRRQTVTCPTLKITKDLVRDAIKDKSITGLESVISISEGRTIKSLVNVSQWFFESYLGSHATVSQKPYIKKRFDLK